VPETVPEDPSTELLQLDQVAHRAPVTEGDQIPSWLLRIQELFFGQLSASSRGFIGVILIAVAVLSLLLLSSLRVVEVVFESLDASAFLGLFLVNWIGNGGILVPIPGARLVGLLMIFQNAVLFPSWEVFAIGGTAMGLGLLSYYIAGARAAQAYAEGDAETAARLAEDAGIVAGEDEQTPQDVSAREPAGAHRLTTAAAAPAAGARRRWRNRVSASFKRAQERAQPVIEKRGTVGVLLLCLPPSPLGTAAAFLGGLMRFGFSRYLAASFAAKYVLAGIIVVAALVFSQAARSVELPL
jgi:hypothetical protein